MGEKVAGFKGLGVTMRLRRFPHMLWGVDKTRYEGSFRWCHHKLQLTRYRSLQRARTYYQPPPCPGTYEMR